MSPPARHVPIYSSSFSSSSAGAKTGLGWFAFQAGKVSTATSVSDQICTNINKNWISAQQEYCTPDARRDSKAHLQSREGLLSLAPRISIALREATAIIVSISSTSPISHIYAERARVMTDGKKCFTYIFIPRRVPDQIPHNMLRCARAHPPTFPRAGHGKFRTAALSWI